MLSSTHFLKFKFKLDSIFRRAEYFARELLGSLAAYNHLLYLFLIFSEKEKLLFYFLLAKQSLRLKWVLPSLRLPTQLCYCISNPQRHQISKPVQKSQSLRLLQKNGSYLQPLHHQQIRRPHLLQGTNFSPFLMDLFPKFIPILTL